MPTTGKVFKVNINTGTSGSPAWTPVADMNAYDRRDTASTSDTEVFGNITYSQAGNPTNTLTLSGLKTLSDPGQEAIRVAKRTSAEADLQILYDGVNGYRQTFNVTGKSEGAAPANFQTEAYDLVPVGTPVVVGTGPLP